MKPLLSGVLLIYIGFLLAWRFCKSIAKLQAGEWRTWRTLRIYGVRLESDCRLLLC